MGNWYKFGPKSVAFILQMNRTPSRSFGSSMYTIVDKIVL